VQVHVKRMYDFFTREKGYGTPHVTRILLFFDDTFLVFWSRNFCVVKKLIIEHYRGRTKQVRVCLAFGFNFCPLKAKRKNKGMNLESSFF
jgi:hypothetical protein